MGLVAPDHGSHPLVQYRLATRGRTVRKATVGVIRIAIVALLIIIHNPVTTSCGGPGICDDPAKIVAKALARSAGIGKVL